ncbi:EF-hand domain-containing protein [Thiosocius teredinicola]|uniref:EF-hand domain-containing protein n=1 Tax=Thiosocius teredinicola TaxID=1973002 RepID=UPI000990AB50
MKKTLLTLAAASAFVLSGVAGAAPTFKKADANGDGSVDAAEFAATKIERKFEKIDKNGDGSLNKDEYMAATEEDCE